jgi:predicted Zn-dependent protease
MRRYLIIAVVLVASFVIFLEFYYVRREHKRVYFVQLGELATPKLDELANYYKQKYDLAIEILPAVEVKPWLMDYMRRQLIAEEVIGQLKRDYPKLANDRTAILIGITTQDMYIREYNWRFAFSWRQEGRFAVVSTARMDPVFFGRKRNDAILESRLRKMITKNIGLMYYGYFQSSDPKSVLYRSVLSIDDLDKIGEDF